MLTGRTGRWTGTSPSTGHGGHNGRHTGAGTAAVVIVVVAAVGPSPPARSTSAVGSILTAGR